MGINQSSSSVSNICKNDLFGAVLAGFGIWTKPSSVEKSNLSIAPVVPSKSSKASSTSNASNVYPLRIVRVNETNPQLAGRMVISGRMADVCAELDRLAA